MKTKAISFRLGDQEICAQLQSQVKRSDLYGRTTKGKVAKQREQAEELLEALIADNVKKGWEED